MKTYYSFIFLGFFVLMVSCKKEKTPVVAPFCTIQTDTPPCSPPVFDSAGAKIYTVYDISTTPDSLDPNANFILFFKRSTHIFRIAFKNEPIIGEYILADSLVNDSHAVVQFSSYNNIFRSKSQTSLNERIYIEQVIPGVLRLTICEMHLIDYIYEVLTFNDIATEFEF